ncbi:transporter substrate-binding domain-containing protein [Neptunomonas sp. XY-337]|uniref:substrate-binding periplasmic protein n=1 Tax=Neptunomonas sp. XY-337 TaxID=2561897 RepID=UPI00145B7E4A|nr:transporter substrate-binding domain-containing protein [Neptunomonas sp. XY-337]
MKILFSLLFGICCTGLLADDLALDKPVSIAAAEYLPFASEELTNNGVLLDIASAAFKEQNLAAQFIFMPWSRTLAMTLGGNTDALAAGFYSQSRLNDFLFSEPILQVTSVFVSRRDGIEAHQLVNGLADLRVAVETGSVFEQQLADSGAILERVTYLEQGIRMLLLGRLDLVLGTKARIDHLMADFTKRERRLLSQLSLFKGKHNLHLLFPKTAKGAQLRSAFNDGLAQLIRTHEYHAILRRHHYIK